MLELIRITTDGILSNLLFESKEEIEKFLLSKFIHIHQHDTIFNASTCVHGQIILQKCKSLEPMTSASLNSSDAIKLEVKDGKISKDEDISVSSKNKEIEVTKEEKEKDASLPSSTENTLLEEEKEAVEEEEKNCISLTATTTTTSATTITTGNHTPSEINASWIEKRIIVKETPWFSFSSVNRFAELEDVARWFITKIEVPRIPGPPVWFKHPRFGESIVIRGNRRMDVNKLGLIVDATDVAVEVLFIGKKGTEWFHIQDTLNYDDYVETHGEHSILNFFLN